MNQHEQVLWEKGVFLSTHSLITLKYTKMKQLFFGVYFFLGTFFWLSAQVTQVAFDDKAWTYSEEAEYAITDHMGKEALHLKKGNLVLQEADFQNGIIEMDICFSSDRGFPGLYFRIEDSESSFNAEEFYLRPHQSGNVDAFQYSPVFNGLSAWQLYHGPGYGQAINFPFNAWFHLKIVINDTQGEIYFNGESKPSFFIPELKRGITRGSIGLRAALSEVYFADFSYEKSEHPKLLSAAVEPEKMPENGVGEWAVAGPYVESTFGNELPSLTPSWKQVPTEASGLLNIAKYVAKKDSFATSLVKLTIDSEEKQLKAIRFGYSDRVKVYCNGQMLYGGQNEFRSRDYRYLGTIGFFDTVVLPLKKGKNELVIAVSENFGGWGIKAAFENMEGIEIIE